MKKRRDEIQADSAFASTRPAPKNAGFTLLEIMVVLAIAGIALAFIVPSIQSHDRATVLKQEALRLKTTLKAARLRAVLHGRPVALIAKGGAYELMDWTNSGWQDLSDAQFVEPRTLADGITLVALSSAQKSNEQNRENNTPTPAAMFMPSGQATPYVLEMFIDGSPMYYRVTGSDDGTVELVKKSGRS